MQGFRSYLKEAKVDKSVSSLKSYLKKTITGLHIKVTDSNRGGYHIRFPVDGDQKTIERFFKNLDFSIKDSNKSISSKFDTFVIKTTKKVGTIPVGTSIHWVNNNISKSTAGGQLFNNKDLSPDSLGLAGLQLSKKDIINRVSTTLKSKYDESTANALIDLMKLANTKSSKISVKDTHKFTSKDLAKVSADFGEILSAIWGMNTMGFKESFFPTASNEKLIDFYGVRMGIHYPISVKSGGGGKVTIQNIIDAIKNRAKTANADHSAEKSLVIFNLVRENPMREGMLKLNQYMETPGIKKLGDIMGVSYKDITLDSLKVWLGTKEEEELITLLQPFWDTLNTKLTDRIKYGSDKVRLVISPLGETLWKILNNDKEIKTSLTNVARQVTLIQVNVDVKSSTMNFQSNRFRDVEFDFGWAGYAGGNKLGFKMKLKK